MYEEGWGYIAHRHDSRALKARSGQVKEPGDVTRSRIAGDPSPINASIMADQPRPSYGTFLASLSVKTTSTVWAPRPSVRP